MKFYDSPLFSCLLLGEQSILMKNQYHFLIVIIVVEMIFTIQLKKEWNKRLNFGIGNMIDRVLSVGRLFQRKQMRRWVR